MKKEYFFPEITIDILTAEDILTASREDELPDDIPDELPDDIPDELFL